MPVVNRDVAPLRAALRTTMGAAVAMVVLIAPVAVTTQASAVSFARRADITLSATWSGSEVVVGRRVRVSGTASPASSVRKVVLQRRMPAGWKSVKSVVPPETTYRMRVPSGWFGSFSYRVKAVGVAGVSPTYSQVKSVRVVPSYAPRGSVAAHTFAASPTARWNSCRVVDYRVNATQASPGALKDVKGALMRVHRATGLRFAYQGTTTIVPQSFFDSYPPDSAMVIAWAKPEQSPLLTQGGESPLGVGGSAWTFGFYDATGAAVSNIRSGHVVIDSTQQDRSPAGFGSGKTRGELLMHEIGHAVGLEHTYDARQIMYPLMQSGVARWGAGDLAGLATLGANQGCLTS